jgi:hypothetical protein
VAFAVHYWMDRQYTQVLLLTSQLRFSHQEAESGVQLLTGNLGSKK